MLNVSSSGRGDWEKRSWRTKPYSIAAIIVTLHRVIGFRVWGYRVIGFKVDDINPAIPIKRNIPSFP